MKTTLIVIQNDADHVQAKALVAKLMDSRSSADQVRMVAQALLIEAYERTRWPRKSPALPDLLTYLMDQHGLSRADLVPLLGTASRVRRSNERQARIEHVDGAQTPRAISNSCGLADLTSLDTVRSCGLN